ncbi:MAG: hypothetical protein A2169_14720 [Deltaproteobacteria bacterium RBG_13_47_9]|nr:MAG: hypothetical protein A2169_14720 [Deltaproteobacteria bacterium RBG_13_47_9]
MRHDGITRLNHISLSPLEVAHKLNERILKLRKSTCPFEAKTHEINFFTPSQWWPGEIRRD